MSNHAGELGPDRRSNRLNLNSISALVKPFHLFLFLIFRRFFNKGRSF